MEITDVRVSLMDDAKLRAFASITIDECFVIRGLKVIQGSKSMFVAMPSRRLNNGAYQDIAHPINADTRQIMEDAVLQAYEIARQDENRTEGMGA